MVLVFDLADALSAPRAEVLSPQAITVTDDKPTLSSVIEEAPDRLGRRDLERQRHFATDVFDLMLAVAGTSRNAPR